MHSSKTDGRCTDEADTLAELVAEAEAGYTGRNYSCAVVAAVVNGNRNSLVEMSLVEWCVMERPYGPGDARSLSAAIIYA